MPKFQEYQSFLLTTNQHDNQQIGKKIETYVDEILVKSKYVEDHVTHREKTFVVP